MKIDPYCAIEATPEAKAAFDHAIKSSASDLKKQGGAKVLPVSFSTLPEVWITCAADITPERIR